MQNSKISLVFTACLPVLFCAGCMQELRLNHRLDIAQGTQTEIQVTTLKNTTAEPGVLVNFTLPSNELASDGEYFVDAGCGRFPSPATVTTDAEGNGSIVFTASTTVDSPCTEIISAYATGLNFNETTISRITVHPSTQ